jgi:flavin-dependent dehydrogenase
LGKNMTDLSNDGTIDETWDCIVIGAGVAGSVAARQAALGGLKTLLVERSSFPRQKVCGACLNHRALHALEAVDLLPRVQGLGAEPIDSFFVKGFGRSFERSLPPGLAVSRACLDSALLEAAEEAGVRVLNRVKANVLPARAHSSLREVRLRTTGEPFAEDCEERRCAAKVVIAADGLGHPSLRGVEGFDERIASGSKIGLGTHFPASRSAAVRQYQIGRIYMAVSEFGYGGIVRVEGGGLNLAAAVDPEFMRQVRTPQAAFAELIRAAEFPELPLDELDWKGTPPLTRTTNTVAHDGILVVGDSAGYVEPFTGEGMSWALVGGRQVATAAVKFVRGQSDQANEDWRRDWQQLIRQRQRWCERLAWLLRHPSASRIALSIANRFPNATDRIVNHMNAELTA